MAQNHIKKTNHGWTDACVEPDKCDGDWAKSVVERTGLSWADAEKQMKEFVNEDPKNHIADYTGWLKLGSMEYVIRLYKATAKVRLEFYDGYHGVYCDKKAFAHEVSKAEHLLGDTNTHGW
jgi:hypothetical protein